MTVPEDPGRSGRGRLTRAGAACTLVHARWLIAQPNAWYQPKPKDAVPRSFFACTAAGADCWATDGLAVAFCPQGAIWRAAFTLGLAPRQSVLEPDPPVVRTALAWLARAVDPRADQALHPAVVVSTWSDNTALTKPRVLAAFDRAGAIGQAVIAELDYPETLIPTGEAA